MNNVAVTGLNAGDSPAPGIPVIRCLREHPDWGGSIIGLAYDALESGILDSSMVDAAYLLPYPSFGKDNLLERIRHIHETRHIDAIIPTLDSEMLNFIQLKSELAALGIHLLLPTQDQFEKRSKPNLEKLAETAGIKTPRTTIITDPSKIDIKREDLPLVIKGLFYEAYIAHSVDDAVQYIHKTAAKWGYPVLVQEYIEGEEFNAAAVCDGETRGLVCMKKLVLTDKGKGWACVSIKNDGLIELTDRVVKTLKWRGAMEIEAIYSRRDSLFYLIEVNPRFPAWIYLAKAAGLNLPYMYLQLAMGLKAAPTTDYKTGVVFTNYTTNLITDISRIDSLFTTGAIQYEKAI